MHSGIPRTVARENMTIRPGVWPTEVTYGTVSYGKVSYGIVGYDIVGY